VRHACDLIRREGLSGILSGVGRFLDELRRSVYRTNYVRHYRLDVDAAVAVSVTPPPGVQVHFIASREDALRLVADGFDDVLKVVPGTGRRLGHGAVAACAFVGTELASIDWIALTARARPVVDPLPYRIDFQGGEACTGGAFTMRRFRRQGIASYRFNQAVHYLHARGFHTCHDAIEADNVASQRCVERSGATFDAVYHERRVFGRSSYKEVWCKAPAMGDAGEQP
jgi:GNAT superfamily N-acetyltransferase